LHLIDDQTESGLFAATPVKRGFVLVA